MDIQEAIDGTLLDAELERARHTARAYKNAIDYSFRNYLTDKKIKPTDDIATITTDVLIEFAPWLLSNGKKKKTVNVYLAALKFFIEWLVIHNQFKPDYHDTVRLEKSYRQARRRREDHLLRHPDKGDPDKMRKAVREMDYSRVYKPEEERARNIAVIELLIATGCRNEEITKLKVGDIDLKKMQAIVNGKGDKERYVYITQQTADALRYYWSIRKFAGKDDPIFTRHDKAATIENGLAKDPITTSTIRNIVKAAANHAGLDNFTPHWFRHAFAIKMMRDTGNLAIVQDLMGHATPETTRVYAKIEREDLEEAHRHAFGR